MHNKSNQRKEDQDLEEIFFDFLISFHVGYRLTNQIKEEKEINRSWKWKREEDNKLMPKKYK